MAPKGPWTPRALATKGTIESRSDVQVDDSALGRRVPAALVTFRQLAEGYSSAPESENALQQLARIYEDLDLFEHQARTLGDLGTRFPQSNPDAWWAAGEIYDRKLNDADGALDAYQHVPPESSRYENAQRRIRRLSN